MKGKKITTANYFETINQIGFENLPLVLKQSHTVIMTKTINGEDWSKYKNDADLKRMIDLVFKKLEEFIASEKINLSGTDDTEEMEGVPKDKPSKKINAYSNISNEVRFIQRFLDFHDKILYKKNFEIFIDELQKAIKEKKITKKSPVAKDIVAIQNAALSAFNTMKNAKHFVLKPATIKHFKSIIEKYENAYDDIDDIDDSYTKVKKKSVGLNGIVPAQSDGKIMNSLDFANLEFSTIGFKDKWLEFIGDPAPGFTAMVYGRPKMGKSYLCVDFAGYLARNHGKVLYVAKEEKLDATLQKKLKDKDVANPNLFVADNLPKNLSDYQFVILDSVNKLELNPKDLAKLKSDNPGVSFIYIFQTTKEGKFRGTNEFQHDVDVVIEIPEKGIAVQNGRFNQGGEMQIFEDDNSENEELSGVQKSKKKAHTTSGSVIEISTELGIPLQELAMELIPPKKEQEEIIDLLDNHPKNAEASVKKMASDFIIEAKADVSIKSIAFTEMDSDNLNHGAAYFSVILKGTKEELEKIAGNNLLFFYDWEKPPMEGLAKKSKHNLTFRNNVPLLDGTKNKTMKKTVNKGDWTNPKHLNPADWRDLKIIKDYCDKGDYESAMNHAMNCDTVIREEIPGDIWKKMGGQLTKTGEEKLNAQKLKATPVKTELEKSETIEKIGKELTVKLEKHSWGELAVLKHGIDWHAILHPEHLEKITALKKGESSDVDDEQGYKWLITNNGDGYNIKSKFGNNKGNFKLIERKQTAPSKKFNSTKYADRKDDDSPSFIFSLTSSKLLAEAIEGDFDLTHLVRRELANRGQDSKGKWVGFDEAKKIHGI
jgi:hypothetical protein